MKRIPLALVLAGIGWALPQQAAAQPWMGFASFSVNTDLNDQRFQALSAGVLLDVADSWISIGAQGDLLMSHGYFAGRGGPFGQVNLLRRRPVRVFALAGMSWGEEAGPMIGGGVEIWPTRRVGVRATVLDYVQRVEGFDCAFFGVGPEYCDAQFHGGAAYTSHRPSFQVGIIWR